MANEPITREEMFLAKAGGQDVKTPEPITRREKLLQGIIDNGGGGGAFVVNVLWNESDDTYSTDKTFNEIKTALDNDERVIFKQPDPAFPDGAYYSFWNLAESGIEYIKIVYFPGLEDTIGQAVLTIYPDGTYYYHFTEVYPELPVEN